MLSTLVIAGGLFLDTNGCTGIEEEEVAKGDGRRIDGWELN